MSQNQQFSDPTVLFISAVPLLSKKMSVCCSVALRLTCLNYNEHGTFSLF